MQNPLTGEVKSLVVRRQVSHKDPGYLCHVYRNIFVLAENLLEVTESEVRVNVTSDGLGENV